MHLIIVDPIGHLTSLPGLSQAQANKLITQLSENDQLGVRVSCYADRAEELREDALRRVMRKQYEQGGTR
jgi:hypothetical protein